VNLAAYIGMERHVYFAGFVPDDDLLKIYSVIDIACFPSLYEPFGIVALEAMAARVPVVVSDAGGLPEVVENNVTGITTYAGNPNSLADGLLRLLHEPDTAARLAGAAYARVQTKFNWDTIAAQTIRVYDRVWAEYLDSDWRAPGFAPAASGDAAGAGAGQASRSPRQ
jgi:glycosyltransferase involved in cell wall biosynthesis